MFYRKEKNMKNKYISVIVDGRPTVIFKRNIIAVTKEKSYTSIMCIGEVVFNTKVDYISVVKKIIE